VSKSTTGASNFLGFEKYDEVVYKKKVMLRSETENPAPARKLYLEGVDGRILRFARFEMGGWANPRPRGTY